MKHLDEIGKDLLVRQMYPYDRKGAKRANMIELAQNGESPELSDAFEKLVQEAVRLETSWQQ